MDTRKIWKKLVKGYRVLNKKERVIEGEKIVERVAEKEKILIVEKMPEEKVREKEIEMKGIEIPSIIIRKVKLYKIEKKEKPKEFVYPLIPKHPSKGEPVFAYARLKWNKEKNRYIYYIVEPKLNSKLRVMLERIRELLEQKIDVDLSKISPTRGREYLSKKIDEIIEYFKFIISPTERQIIKYYIERDFLGLGKIEPLMRDPNIEDISCDGVGIPVFIFHRDPEIGSVETNIVFNDREELDSFVIKLAQICGKSISVTEPLINGMLPDGSRLQATLGSDIARRGSNFTIRKFSEKPLTPIHLLKYGTLDLKSLTYLWMIVDYGRSVLISGGTASGKTTMLNVLSLFIRPAKKVISIEDTPEIRLPHPHWIPVVARTPVSTGKRGEIDMFDLLKESLRQRPDYIILGEVRGKEAYILFQQIATGHPSLATIHSEDMIQLFNRLITPPISLPPHLLESLDVVVFMHRLRVKDKNVRRATEIVEVLNYDENEKRIKYRKLFVWNSFNDKIEVKDKSLVLEKISKLYGLSEEQIKEEFKRRYLVLEWLFENNITNYEDVYRIISLYYSDPNKLISMIMSG
ncbi:MAG: type II/IV secretion system ATPase subunit [Candidatus Aenigmarchaeota archaeon]|nr:type II/IV secretion system ATPase subunit [Candidatus Aenigmarchaeota archaeon]